MRLFNQILFTSILLLISFQSKCQVDTFLNFYKGIHADSIFRKFKNEREKIIGKDTRFIYHAVDDQGLFPVKVCYLVISNNALSYNYGEDIIKYLEIDTKNYHIYYRNNKGKHVFLIGKQTGLEEIVLYDMNATMGLKKANISNNFLSRILKQHPDAIFYSFSFYNRHNILLYIKNKKIYAIRKCFLFKPIELNKYVTKYYKQIEIQNLARYSEYFKGMGPGFPDRSDLNRSIEK